MTATAWLAVTVAACGVGAPTPTPTPPPTDAPSPTAEPSATAALPSRAPLTAATTIVAAGRIARCDNAPTAQTAALVEAIDGLVLTLGDHAYPGGTARQFAQCYEPTWGGFRERTHPVPGNHDYLDRGAAGYFGYFGDRAGEAGQGWYAFEAGGWRLYALNSECDEVGGCGAGDAQYEWLRDELRAQPRDCVLAYWHRPVHSSGRDGGDPAMSAILALLHDHGADIVLTADDHLYERLAPADATGRPDAERGVRQFNVGTGGIGLHPYGGPPLPITEVRDNTSHGVLRLDLAADGYSWEFLPVLGARFRDAGSNSCRP